MVVSLIQGSFAAGEISPELYGQVDLQKMHVAATTLRNMLVNYRGGALSRGGLAYVGRCKQSVTGSGPPRPIPFQFSITQGYILEFGDNYVRFVYMGGYVLENPVTITGVSNSDPCQIDVAGTPFANNDWVYISGVNGTTQLNGNTYIVSGAASGHFLLEDLNGNPVDATGFGVYTSGGTAARIYTVSTPYAAVDLPYLKFSQSADVMTLTCSNPVTGTEYPPYNLTRNSAASWTLAAITFGAAISPPASTSAIAQSSSSTVVNYEYVVTAVNAVTGEESIASTPAGVLNNDISVNLGTNTVSWSQVTGAGSYNIYSAVPSYNVPVPVGVIHGYVGNSTGLSFTDTNITPDYTQVPPVHQNPFAQGAILGSTAIVGGSNYSQQTIGLTISTGTGSGFVGQALVVNGAFAGIFVQNGGQDYLPTDTFSVTDSGGGLATGDILFSANPAASSNVTFNGQVITFKAVPVNPGDVHLENTLALTLQTLADYLESQSANLSLACADYTVDATHIYVTYKTPGAVGNAYTLSAGGSSNGTPSGATLSGGGTMGSGASGTLVVGPASGTYPGVCAYFQQRLFFADSFNNPDTFWTSKTGAYFNMDSSIPTSATDAITATPWTEQVNGVQWLVPMPGGLITMTGNRAWQIVGEGSYNLNSQPITPSTTQAQPQAFNGCSATIPPIPVDYDVLYCEAVGNTTVRDLSWTAWTNIYTGADLTILATHLFLYQQIVQWTWARKPYKAVWACRDDGTLISLTYLKEQEVFGWARHDTQGLVVGIASVTEPPVNAVYCVVQRFPPYAPAGIYVMERMDNRIWQSVEDSYAVDSGVSNPMSNPSATLLANSASGAVTFTASAAVFSAGTVGQILRMGGGIASITGHTDTKHVTGAWVLGPSLASPGVPFAPSGSWTLATPVNSLNAPHLAGMQVVGLADGIPFGPVAVGPTGTIALPFEASNVKAGLPFTPQIQSPYLNGGEPTVQGRRKAIPAVTVRLAASGPFQVGVNQPDGQALSPPQVAPAWTNMAPSQEQQQGATTYQSPAGQTVTQLWTGDIRQIVDDSWAKPGQVAVQQTLPQALEVLAVIPEILEGDTPEETYRQQPPSSGGQQQEPRTPGRWMLRRSGGL
jgi:hypothetical protein